MLNKKDLGASDAEASHQDRHAARGAHNKDTRGSKPTRDALTEQRKRLRDTGFAPIPVAGKKPVPEEWQKKTTVTDTEIETWSGYNSTGLITRLMPALDVDIYNPEAAKAVEELVRERFEARGKLLVRIGNAPKYAIPFRTDKSFKKITANLTPPEDDPTAVYLQRGDSFRPTDQKIELLGDGQQLVAFGEHPDTRRPYRWIGGEPGEVRRDELPELTEAEARRLVDDVAQLLCDKFGYTGKQSARSEDATRAPNDKLAADDITELAAAVEAIPNDIPDWEDWNSIMMAIWAATGGSEEGFEIADRWCAKWEGYDANETRRRWEAISKSPPTGLEPGRSITWPIKRRQSGGGGTRQSRWRRVSTCGGKKSRRTRRLHIQKRRWRCFLLSAMPPGGATSLRGINGSALTESNGRSMRRARRGRSLASSAAKLQAE